MSVVDKINKHLAGKEEQLNEGTDEDIIEEGKIDFDIKISMIADYYIDKYNHYQLDFPVNEVQKSIDNQVQKILFKKFKKTLNPMGKGPDLGGIGFKSTWE